MRSVFFFEHQLQHAGVVGVWYFEDSLDLLSIPQSGGEMSKRFCFGTNNTLKANDRIFLSRLYAEPTDRVLFFFTSTVQYPVLLLLLVFHDGQSRSARLVKTTGVTIDKTV